MYTRVMYRIPQPSSDRLVAVWSSGLGYKGSYVRANDVARTRLRPIRAHCQRQGDHRARDVMFGSSLGPPGQTALVAAGSQPKPVTLAYLTDVIDVELVRSDEVLDYPGDLRQHVAQQKPMRV
eukprot:scaffold106147_cov38-Prasinocladus_malaysianus.AAC.1